MVACGPGCLADLQLRSDRGPAALPVRTREDLAAAQVDVGYALVRLDVRRTGVAEGMSASPGYAAEVAAPRPSAR